MTKSLRNHIEAQLRHSLGESPAPGFSHQLYNHNVYQHRHPAVNGISYLIRTHPEHHRKLNRDQKQGERRGRQRVIELTARVIAAEVERGRPLPDMLK